MSEFALEARQATKRFRGFTAVNGVDLRVRRGSIHALIGPNGAGKSTLFGLLTRFLPLSSGQILYHGRDTAQMDAADLAREGLVRSFQISSVFPTLSARENVRIALQRRRGPCYRFWKYESSLGELHDQADELLAQVGLQSLRHVRAADLPYGRKRALELATTLALDPKVMLLDEPMAGIGHEYIDFVADVIRKAATGRTVVMVEHNLRVVAQLSNTITVLARGEVLAEGSYAEVAANPQVQGAYLGGLHA